MRPTNHKELKDKGIWRGEKRGSLDFHINKEDKGILRALGGTLNQLLTFLTRIWTSLGPRGRGTGAHLPDEDLDVAGSQGGGRDRRGARGEATAAPLLLLLVQVFLLHVPHPMYNDSIVGL